MTQRETYGRLHGARYLHHPVNTAPRRALAKLHVRLPVKFVCPTCHTVWPCRTAEALDITT